MTQRLPFAAIAAFSILLIACGDDAAGDSEDAGSTPVDASTLDGGSPDDGGASDAAVEADAGADLCASVDCTSLDDACHAGTCDPVDGTCFAQPLANGTACNDGQSETSDDMCLAGACVGAPPDTADDDTLCRYAARRPGYLDQFQDANDDAVLFCHKDGLGEYHFVNSTYNACLTHWDNHRTEQVVGDGTVQTGDVFPTLGCGA